MAIACVFLFGIIIGSFLNVLVYRIPREGSVVSPARSFCPSCNHQLSWYDNIPLFSWLFLFGRCRYCKKEISWRYPLIELLSGIAAVQSVMQFGLNPTGIVIYLLTASLIVITFIDLEFKIIPNVISFPGMTCGLLLGIVSQYYTIFQSPPITSGVLDSLIGFFLGSGIFYLIGWGYYAMTKRVGLGGGDIKLLAMTGSILGWESVPQTILFGAISGAIVGVLVMLVKKSGRHTEIPFGPWLALGALIYIFCDLPIYRF